MTSVRPRESGWAEFKELVERVMRGLDPRIHLLRKKLFPKF
jgi:hypothetical protein